MILIDGIALGGYRSFGRTVQRMGPFEQINLFAGPNNSGKSNILRFLTEHLCAKPEIRIEGSKAFADVDKHIAAEPVPFVLGLGRRRDYTPIYEAHSKLPGQYA